jgi:hypothetical protein
MSQSKKPRLLEGGQNNHAATVKFLRHLDSSLNDLSVDELATIFGFLPPKQIMRMRRVSKRWGEAVKKSSVPRVDFVVQDVPSYNAMNAMTGALPNLEKMTLSRLGWQQDERGVFVRHKFVDGDDPDEKVASETTDWTANEIGIITRFKKLRILNFHGTQLNGRYPFLFNFPLLQRLQLWNCHYLKFDLDMLATGLPILKELSCLHDPRMTGNINSLRALRPTLVKLKIYNCRQVEGDFMDMADFPCLKELNLNNTAVRGDVRKIRENDFAKLTQLDLPEGAYGGKGYEFQHVSDAPDLIRTLYLFKKNHPTLLQDWYGKLSESSPDWYESLDERDSPPFYIFFVEAGSRVGYRWETVNDDQCCEVNWLDPEPSRDRSDYAEYIQDLQEMERQVNLYRGYYQPPSEEEYNRLYEEYYNREILPAAFH